MIPYGSRYLVRMVQAAAETERGIALPDNVRAEQCDGVIERVGVVPPGEPGEIPVGLSFKVLLKATLRNTAR